ncbi:4-hydroxy-3-methylbut-2-enyl diphosphate reductase [Sphingomonas sp. PP-F2F-G114-C0414]|uniref:4-hydroxy-3-methylbut-2-enyl diphosphate reductase n=1 Tax=Sphingomonas sp. PP-F2F-G114-C0414 TaxID=2135662 RepID=UPI00217EA96C|nr:4-hydroxy-3-methylbut-2-enyl diphosphate reductase [Sphingomonas sp. PP-F2F-G114-C0414]
MTTPLQVILAQPRGFCAGVVRAIDIVEKAIERYSAPVYVRHEIVHNRHVVDKLRRKGAVFVEDLTEIPPGAVTIFSAHGVARSVQEEARLRELPVLDATCPLVTKVHIQGRRYAKSGRTIVLIGHAGHVEVIGTMGQVDAPMHLVSTPEEVEALSIPVDTPIAYVTQTTLSVDDTRGVIMALHARFADVEGPDVSEICYATQNRQTAVRDLARVSDMLIVVGAANSSNSNRLREIGAEMGIPSYLVDDGDGVDPVWLDGVAAVGITAGASAPDELVDSVIAALRLLRPVRVSQLDGVEENVEFSLPAELRMPRATAAAAE